MGRSQPAHLSGISLVTLTPLVCLDAPLGVFLGEARCLRATLPGSALRDKLRFSVAAPLVGVGGAVVIDSVVDACTGGATTLLSLSDPLKVVEGRSMSGRGYVSTMSLTATLILLHVNGSFVLMLSSLLTTLLVGMETDGEGGKEVEEVKGGGGLTSSISSVLTGQERCA